MAGYSDTPLARKLGIKPAHRVALLNAPQDLALEGLPEDASIARSLRASTPVDVIVLFPTTNADLRRRLPAATRRLATAGGLWVAWPKKASGVRTDLTESLVRRAGLDAGLVDNKICAISEIYSGLRFVYRLRDR